MYIKHDYSYITGNEYKLVDAGYGEMTVHSLRFGRYYTEEQKAENLQKAHSMSKEQWNKYCEEISKSFDKPLKEILSHFIDKYNIHQISEETSTISHYDSDWDLHFWSNRGWNGTENMDCFVLTFNKRRNPEQNMQMLKKIISLIEVMEYSNIGCRIQYDAVINKKAVEEATHNIIDSVLGKFIDYRGMTGKIRLIGEENGVKKYGFFKKGAKSHYYHISNMEILAMKKNVSQTI